MSLKFHKSNTGRAAEAARAVKLLVLDLDGVMTDGGLYYRPDGDTIKRFHVHDGFGIKIAMDMGIEVAVNTGLKSVSARARMDRLGINYYVEGQEDKLGPLDEIRRACGLDWRELAYVGDDWVDLAPMAASRTMATTMPRLRFFTLIILSNAPGLRPIYSEHAK